MAKVAVEIPCVHLRAMVVAGSLIAGCSCSRPGAVPFVARDDANTRASPPPPAPSAPVVDDASVADGALVVLPPQVDHCTADSECGMTSLDLSGPTVCCFRCCSAHGGSKSWVDAVEAICASAPKTACRDYACACPMPAYKPKCTAGRCVLTY